MTSGIKETVKNNLIRLRKENKLTQFELSQKINYSDKAISRWETGEVTPDVETLAALAALYNTSITVFFLSPDEPLSKDEKRAMRTAEKQAKKQEKQTKKIEKFSLQSAGKGESDPLLSRRLALLIFNLCFLWATVLSLFFVLNAHPIWGAWRVFVWGAPGTLFLLLVFFWTPRRKALLMVFGSLFAWTLLAAIYIQIARWMLFPIFFIGIPLQAVILLFPFLKKKK